MMHSKIIKLHIETDIMYLELECHYCRSVFKHTYSTIAGVLICKAVCTQCDSVNCVFPDDLKSIITEQTLLPNLNGIAMIMEVATMITENWYLAEPYTTILDYDGINLGESAERELLSFVWQGLQRCRYLSEGDCSA